MRSWPTSGCQDRTDIRSFAPFAVSQQAQADPFLLSRSRHTRPCENVEEALTAGFNAHMGKPVDPEQLVATIAAAVNAATHPLTPPVGGRELVDLGR